MVTPRVVESMVADLFATTIPLGPFIQTAALIVTERLTGHYSAARLIEIERWLAAHLAAQQDPRLTETRADEITLRYESAKVGEGLNGTRYGQQVRLLDYKGLLTQDMQSTVARFSVH